MFVIIIMLRRPRYCSASGLFAECGIPNGKAIIRNLIYKFITRLNESTNDVILAILSSDIKWKMSPAILARLFLAVVFPSATYGLRSIHTNETFDFLDEVQGRLIKAWFGVSKYCSTSSLRAAIGWRKASGFHLSTSAEPKCT